MAFTQVPITGTINLSNAIPANGAVVTFTLNTAITDGTTLIAPEPVAAHCNSSGVFTITLNANDDSTTTPTGTYYQVVITYGLQTLNSFNVIVPHADSGGVDLFALAPLVNPNIAVPFVEQIQAGSGISLSPSGGTGVVTISATGGGGGSTLTPTAVQSSGTYTASVGDEVLVDLSTASVAITLPTAPADKGQIGWKIVKYTAGNTLTIDASDSDAFEIIGGSTSQTGQLLDQAKVYQYEHSASLWIALTGDNALGQLDARYLPTVQGATGTNLGAAQTLNFNGQAHELWLVGALSANLTVTLSNRVAGCKALILVTQPASGGPYTLTISDGSNTQAVLISTAASALSVVQVDCPDSAALDASTTVGLAPSAQIFTATGTYTIPAGATMLEITAIGGGAGGGGGGSNASGAANGGGAGGGAGADSTQVVAIGSNTSLTVTVGPGGAGGAGAAAGGAAGTHGTAGTATTVIGTGINVTANGGAPGTGGPANATTTVDGGVKGAAGILAIWGGFGAAPGVGGSSSGGGIAATGGAPGGYSGGGGGGGNVSSTSQGGNGGASGSLTAGGAIGSGTTGTTNGGTPASAAANTGAGGGGGGGGTNNTGTGGTGGAGGSGYAIIKVVG